MSVQYTKSFGICFIVNGIYFIVRELTRFFLHFSGRRQEGKTGGDGARVGRASNSRQKGHICEDS